MIESERALQRHAAERPLLLRIQRFPSRALTGLERLQIHRQQIGHAVIESVLQVRVVGEVALVHAVIRRLVAELHAVGAGDVRRGAAPR